MHEGSFQLWKYEMLKEQNQILQLSSLSGKTGMSNVFAMLPLAHHWLDPCLYVNLSHSKDQTAISVPCDCTLH